MLSVIFNQNPHIDRLATRTTFFSAGFVTAAWATLIPLIKSNLLLTEGIVGLMLLILGLGSLIGMPIAGICSGKYGCKRVLISSLIGISLLYPLILLADSPTSLATILVIFGMCLGITECAMNIHAVAVERDAKTPLMSGFHGFFSLGGVFGATSITLLLSIGLAPLLACIVVSVFIVTSLTISADGFRREKSGKQSQLLALPKGPVLLIGVVSLIIFLTEGTVLDWSGVYLTEYHSIPATSAGLGVISFSIAMTVGRLVGDRVIFFVGSRAMIVYGASIAILGFILSLSFSYWQIAIVGYALIGLGCSNIVPIMFSAAGKQNVMPEASAVTAVSTLSYFGVLAGPALVGMIAEIYSLASALYVIAALVLFATLLSLKIKI